MATFSILSQPQDLSTAYNELYLTLDSDLKTLENFIFIADVMVGGVLVDRLRIPVNPNGYGEVDIQRVIKQFIDSEFEPNSLSIENIPNAGTTYSIDFNIKFRDTWTFYDNFILDGNAAFYSETDEPYFQVGDTIYITQDSGYSNIEYEGVAVVTETGYTASGLFGTAGYYVGTNTGWAGSTPVNGGDMTLNNFELITLSQTQSITDKYAFYGRIDWEDFIGTEFTDYICSTASVGKFMTNVPNDYNVNINDRMFLNVYTEANTDLRYLYIQSGNGTFRMTNTHNAAGTDVDDRLLRVPVGPYELENGSFSVMSGSLPILDSSVATYSVWMTDSSFVPTTEVKTFKYNQANCTSYDTYQLIFLDKLGSFIPFDFTLRDIRKIDIKRNEFTQNVGGYSTTGGDYTYNTWDRGRKQSGNTYEKSYTLRTDYIDQETSDFLQELLYSNEVYMISPDDSKIYSVIIDTKTYNLERRKNGLIRFDINVKPSFKNYTQD